MHPIERTVRAIAGVCALAILLGGCAVLFPEPTPRPLPPVTTTVPDADLTVIDSADEADASIRASVALFATSPVTVVAFADDERSRFAAASTAIALGVPLLIANDDNRPLLRELDRLGTTDVVAIGPAPEGLIEERVLYAVDATPGSIGALLGIELTERRVADDASVVGTLAELAPGEAVLLTPEAVGATASPSPGALPKPLPELRRGVPRHEVAVLGVDGEAQFAPVTTARAAGAQVLAMPADAPNPQTSPQAIELLSAPETSTVLAIGTEYAAEPSLEWKVASARTGLQLPGGGQLLFPEHTIVAMYGTPGVPVLGVLGEQGLEASIDRAKSHANKYADLLDTTVIPGFEIIATVASASAGHDGNYSNELPIDELLRWASAAGDAGMYVVIDLQPGRTDFLTQARRYEPLLELPWVGIALDPEWRLEPHQRHLVQIGSVDAAEVNQVIGYLAGLVQTHNLPPKLLVLHQFRLDMIEHRGQVEVDHEEVTVLIHADGQGSQPAKQETWRRLHKDAPAVAWGWKNFYDEDLPMLSAEQTIAQVSPTPQLITYQ